MCFIHGKYTTTLPLQRRFLNGLCIFIKINFFEELFFQNIIDMFLKICQNIHEVYIIIIR